MSTVKQKLIRGMSSSLIVKQADPKQAHALGTLRVLAADGCKDTVESMSTLVEMWGNEVAEAHDATTALAKASGFRPHVLLLDIAMPGREWLSSRESTATTDIPAWCFVGRHYGKHARGTS